MKYKSKNLVSFRSFYMVIHPSDVTCSPGIITGNYEKYQLDLVSMICRPGDRVLDVGANIGIFSLEAGRSVGNHGMVVAIEPEPTNLELLKRNITENSCTNVSIIQAAVSDSTGSANLVLDPSNSGTHVLERHEDAPLHPNSEVPLALNTHHQIEVQTITASEAASVLGGHIRLMKVDVEGFEPAVITQQFLSLHRPEVLMVEFVPRLLRTSGYEPRVFFELLSMHFEDVFIIAEHECALKEIFTYEDVAESNETNLLLLSQSADRGFLSAVPQ